MGNNRKRTLHHVQPPILLMRQINRRSHFTDLASHVRPMLRLQGSSLSWVSFDLSTKHVLWTNGSIPWNVSPFTNVLRKQCAAFPDEKPAGNKSVFQKNSFNRACSHHRVQISMLMMPELQLKSTACTFSRQLQCALRNQILLWYRHISNPEAIPPHHLCFALSWRKATHSSTHPVDLRLRALGSSGSALCWEVRPTLPLRHCQLLFVLFKADVTHEFCMLQFQLSRKFPKGKRKSTCGPRTLCWRGFQQQVPFFSSPV